MIITTYDLDHYLKKLENELFCFVRYGDGEFQALNVLEHKYNWNCDKHEYTPELASELLKTLQTTEPGFTRAIGHKAAEDSGYKLITEFLVENNCSLEWHNTEVFLDASLSGNLNPFIKLVRGKKTLYICPEKLESFVKKELDADHVVTVPILNSYLEIDSIEREVLALLENHEVELILISAGFLAKCLLYRLFVLDKIKINMIDIGSTFDGYVKDFSRSHVKRLKKDKIQKNLKR